MTTGRGLRVGEAGLAFGVLALGLFITVTTASSAGGGTQGLVGPQLFPLLIGGGLLLVGAALLRQAVAGNIAHAEGMALDWRGVALVSAGLLVQLTLLESLGWIIATGLLFLAVTLAFGSLRVLLNAAIGFALAGLVFVAFNYGLDLSLPQGSVLEGLTASPEDDAS